MSAFARAVAKLHAGPMAIAAAFHRAVGETWTPLRVIETSASEETGSARSRAKTVEIQAADLADGPPLRNDFVEITPTLYRIDDAEPDTLGLSYACRLALASAQEILTIGTSDVGGSDGIG